MRRGWGAAPTMATPSSRSRTPPPAPGRRGPVGWFNTLRSWDEIVSVNGVPLAKVGGSAVPDTEGPTLTPLGGPLFLMSEERQILLDFIGAPGTIQHGLAAVLGAGAHLVTIAP